MFALLILPTLAVLALTAAIITERNRQYASAEAGMNVATLARQVARLDQALGDEALQAVKLVTPALGGQSADNELIERFDDAARRTDLRLESLQELLARNQAHGSINEAAATAEAASKARSDVRYDQIDPFELADRYTSARAELIEALSLQGSLLEDAKGQQRLLGLVSLITASGEHLNERLAVELALRYRQWPEGQHSKAIASPARQDEQLKFALIRLSGTDNALPETAELVVPEKLTAVRQQILADDIPDIAPGEWVGISDLWLTRLTTRISFEQQRIAVEMRTALDRAASLREVTLLAVGGVVFSTLLLAGVVAFRLVRRVSTITDQARRMANGQPSLETFPAVGGRDELGQLAQAFDEMIWQVENRARIQSVEASTLDAIAQGADLATVLEQVIHLFGVDQAGQPLYQFTSDVPATGGLPAIEPVDSDRTPPQPAEADRRTAAGLIATARRRVEDRTELAWQANHDALTGLLSRGAIVNRLVAGCSAATGFGQDATYQPFGLFHIDLDWFKKINDTHGHSAGDQLLIKQSQRLRKMLAAAGGTVGRFGGDEFLALVPDIESSEALTELGDRIVNDLARPVRYRNITLEPSVSVGAAISRRGLEPRALFNEADQALYEAKRLGRGRAVISSAELRDQLRRVGRARDAVKNAVLGDELTPWYQPIWSGDGRSLAGLEAVARWQHPEKGPLDPSEFVPIADELNLIVELDVAVFEKVCRDATEWLELGCAPNQLHMNMSTQWLEEPGMVDQVMSTIRDTRCPPELIVLEVTESGLMTEMEANIARLQELRDFGIRIAVDDFGQGHSSLAYLQELPLDILKIDRRFVDRVDVDDANQAIVKAIIDLARNFDLTVVAEGLERPEELEYLHRAGTDLYQGFLLGRPSPVSQTAKLLEANRDRSFGLDIGRSAYPPVAAGVGVSAASHAP